MNAKAALAKALLDGNVLTVMNCFKFTGLTNIGREIPRLIERPFGVFISRVKTTGKSRYGEVVMFTQYRLNPTIPENAEGIERMKAYVNSYIKQDVESKPFEQLNFL